MFKIHDPEQAAAFVVGVLILTAIGTGAVVAFRHGIGALVNLALARPVWLVWQKVNKVQEWRHHKHSVQYVRAYRRSLEEIETWLHEQEPELVTT